MNESTELTGLSSPENHNDNSQTGEIASLSVDQVSDEIGRFGLYQILVGLCTGAALIILSFDIFNFIFAATVPEHRCWIPECEPSDTSQFHSNWTKYAIPSTNGAIDSCSRYAYIPSAADGTCSEQNFNVSQVISCNSYIIRNHEERLVSRLNIVCTGYEDKMPLIGTASTVAKSIGVLLAGVASDKLGRLKTIAGSLMLGAFFGCLQSLPAPFMTFELYAALEFLVSFVTSGIIGIGYVYNMEWMTAEYRVYANGIATFTNAFHAAFIGSAAWYFEDNFVAFKLSMAVPGFLMILFYVILGETPQWLLARQKYSQLVKTLSRAGKINRHPPSSKLVRQLQSHSMFYATKPAHEQNHNELGKKVTVRDLLRQKQLTFRLITLSFVWICAVFAYFGIILSSTKVHDNKYISYILIGLAEVPGALLAIVILNRFSRRASIGGTLLTSGSLLILATQLPGIYQKIQLTLFFICRAAIKIAMVGLCTYTTELWPTTVRNRAFNICSLSGRVGGILATLSVLLIKYYAQLPLILYGSCTIIGAVMLYVMLPETMYCSKLPDTIEEALAIGRVVKPNSDGNS